MKDMFAFDAAVYKMRQYFREAKGFIEVPTQSRRSILAEGGKENSQILRKVKKVDRCSMPSWTHTASTLIALLNGQGHG